MLTGLVAHQAGELQLPLFPRSDEVTNPKPPSKGITYGEKVIPEGRNFR
jgi:hypothetical protein